ncbi:flagellar basal body P-ring formation protein FlgA [Cohaesibacter sp. CAU 1516]|uniref:flagellar basal body P-ring formation chaperone FlgA n=1 Tax=Cohaesibacter sp. CAU 1516 TaxID=2576038 RepID=UPI0010FE5F92|nr:flagellar basal body P-ring formation chaperone FlgA [Cohaesibacter sp. CAU 1516]TLP48531.1 flagellar basal body P-ring formation protein FlgA [Cohaesibacter sp. CAU 1516]
MKRFSYIVKKHCLRRGWVSLAFSAIALLSFTGTSHAQAAQTAQAEQAAQNREPAILIDNVTVSETLVRLGDLFRNAGSLSNKAVFRAPSIGQSGTISALRVIDAARRAGLHHIAPSAIQTVHVRRASELVTEQDVTEGIKAQLRAKGYIAASGRVDMELSSRLIDQHASPAVAHPFDLRNLRFDRNSGRFSTDLFIGGREDIGTIRLTGRAIETVMAPVLTRNMRRGEVVAESDVTLTPMPRQQAILAKPASIKDIIGMATRQPLRAGIIANEGYFVAPDIVERSANVTILFKAGSLTLSMMGKALTGGAKGDIISVQNVQTNRIVRAQVIDRGLLQINTPTTSIAALGATE